MSLTPDFIRAEIVAQSYEISLHADNGGITHDDDAIQ
jgi:hypothetical protein